MHSAVIAVSTHMSYTIKITFIFSVTLLTQHLANCCWPMSAVQHCQQYQNSTTTFHSRLILFTSTQHTNYNILNCTIQYNKLSFDIKVCNVELGLISHLFAFTHNKLMVSWQDRNRHTPSPTAKMLWLLNAKLSNEKHTQLSSSIF